MNEPYLILHKVRGEPAFDIAERCDDMGSASDPGPWWIIPTSGHRAYPQNWWPVQTLYSGYRGCQPFYFLQDDPLLTGFAHLPDHYPPRSSPSASRKAISSLLATLGLAPKAVEIKRRKL